MPRGALPVLAEQAENGRVQLQSILYTGHVRAVRQMCDAEVGVARRALQLAQFSLLGAIDESLPEVVNGVGRTVHECHLLLVGASTQNDLSEVQHTLAGIAALRVTRVLRLPDDESTGSSGRARGTTQIINDCNTITRIGSVDHRHVRLALSDRQLTETERSSTSRRATSNVRLMVSKAVADTVDVSVLSVSTNVRQHQ